MDVHLTGVHLIDMYPMSVYFMRMHLTGVRLVGVYLNVPYKPWACMLRVVNLDPERPVRPLEKLRVRPGRGAGFLTSGT